jgi:hypothetical protein
VSDPIQLPARPGVGAVVARSMVRPVNLLAGGVVLVAAVALASWSLAAAGAGLYLVLVVASLASPSFRRKAFDASLAERGAAVTAAAEEGLEPSAIRDPALRDGAAQVRRAMAELRRVLAEGDAGLEVASVRASVDELAARAVHLVRSGDEIGRHLFREDPAALRRELERLEEKVRGAPDPDAARQWEDAARFRREHLRVLAELSAAQERILASLSRIAASLDGLSSRVVRVAALDAEERVDLSGDLGAELARINAEVSASEETLRAVK